MLLSAISPFALLVSLEFHNLALLFVGRGHLDALGPADLGDLLAD